MAAVLTKHQLKNMSEYRYKVEGATLLDPWMQVYWNWLAKQLPLWLAPNAITVFGLFVNVLTTLILVAYSEDARQSVPGWAYFLSAFGMFVYQSLDAIDGKQARRTQSSSPLGELVDHGCDAVANATAIIGTCVAYQLGFHFKTMMCFCCLQSAVFYCAQWQIYITGTMNIFKIDMTEGEFYVLGMYLLSGTFGENVWSTEVPLVGIELNVFLVSMYVVFALIRISGDLVVICSRAKSVPHGITSNRTDCMLPIFPILMVLGCQLALQFIYPSQVYSKHGCLYIGCFALLYANISVRLTVSTVTKIDEHLRVLCYGFIGPGLLFINQCFNCYFNQHITLWICFVLISADLLWFSRYICRQMCDHLNIHCFTITSRPTDNSTVSNGRTSRAITHEANGNVLKYHNK